MRSWITMSNSCHMLNNKVIMWIHISTQENCHRHQVRTLSDESVSISSCVLFCNIVVSSPGPSLDKLDYEVNL